MLAVALSELSVLFSLFVCPFDCEVIGTNVDCKCLSPKELRLSR